MSMRAIELNGFRHTKLSKIFLHFVPRFYTILDDFFQNGVSSEMTHRYRMMIGPCTILLRLEKFALQGQTAKALGAMSAGNGLAP